MTIGIEVGAGQVTLSSPEGIKTHAFTASDDLLTKIAAGLPLIEVASDKCTLHSAAERFAQIIASALDGNADVAAGDRAESDTDRVGVAVPGWWSPRALEHIKSALTDLEIPALLINDAEAAAAQWNHENGKLSDTVAVISLRSKSTSIVLVDVDGAKPRAQLTPTFSHDQGGSDLDAMLLRHLISGLNDMGAGIDICDASVIQSARLAIDECRELRESLSASNAVSAQLTIAGSSHNIRIVRSELEEIAAPWIQATLRQLQAAIAQTARPIESTLLVGGLAAMPLISQQISAELGLTILVPPAPHVFVAKGARLLMQSEIDQSPTWRSRWKKWQAELERRLAIVRSPHSVEGIANE